MTWLTVYLITVPSSVLTLLAISVDLAISDLLTVTLVVPFDVEALFLHVQWKH